MDKIIENAQFSPSRSNIIKNDNGYILKDVVLLSEYSKNPGPSGKPRRYTKETQEDACPHFNNLPICVNHPSQGLNRDALTTVGKSVNPRVVTVQEGGKTVTKTIGDVHLIDCDASTHIVKLGQLDPRLLGMSITGDGSFKEDVNGYDNVAKLKPNTSDFVHRPATTKGLFESIQEDSNLAPTEKTEILGKLSEITDELEESFRPRVKIAPKEQKPAAKISESEEKIGDDSNGPGRLSAMLKGIKTSAKASKSTESTKSEESEEVTAAIVESEGDNDEDEIDVEVKEELKREVKKAAKIKPVAVKPVAVKEDEDEDEESEEDSDDTGDEDEDGDDTGDEDGDGVENDGDNDSSEFDDTDGDSANDEDGDSELDNDQDDNQDDDEGDPEVDPAEGGDPEEEAKAITDNANAATFEANTQDTPEAHMDAVFAHCGACAQLAGIDKNTAYAHFQKAIEHNEAANELKDKEAPDMMTPAPETSEESDKTEDKITEAEITEEIMKEDFETMGIIPTPVMISAYSKLSESERPAFLKDLLPALQGTSRVSLTKETENAATKTVAEGKQEKPKKFAESLKSIFPHTNPKEDDASKVRSLKEVVK